MKKLLIEKYKMREPQITKLVGYDIDNYKITDKEKTYILKIHPAISTEINLATAENELLFYIHKKRTKYFPFPKENTNKLFLTPFTKNNTKKTARVLTYLEGDYLGNAEHSYQLFRSFGAFLAHLDLSLKDFRNYVIEARQLKWDLQHFLLNEKYVSCIPNPSDRKIVAYYFLQYKQHVLPVLPNLRKQIIHNDANEWNTLTKNERVTGLIDFGDVCYSQLINELAIALAYALMGKDDPIRWATRIISAYHKILPLQEKEIEILYWLIAARLCTSVCNSAFERIERPANTYIQISEKPAWDLLKKWATINPVFAENKFRKAAGFDIQEVKKIKDVKTERFNSLNSIFSISYKKPIYMESAAFQYMFDKYGNRYLDAYNNIPHVGHSHPRVVEAAQKQLAKLNTNTRYLYDNLNEYTANLLAHFPKPLNKVFLVNSGSAAGDLALRLARNFTGNKNIAALEYGYHGNTTATIEISHYKFAGKGGTGVSENVIPLSLPDVFRGKFRGPDARIKYTREAHNRIITNNCAALITEPIVGCGGQIPLPDGYLKTLYKSVRDGGGVCISDEVQTGFGRLGDVYWGFEQHDVVPDIVVLGKPMGNGHPIGAVVTTDEIADAFNNGMEFFSSFGGNPVSCAIGQAVLDVIEEEQLQQNAKKVGDYYIQELRQLQQKYECIGDVRGSGLFIGFEFVKDRLTLEPDTEIAQKLKNELRNRHILVSTDGPYENVIKSKPPLCFSMENVEEVIIALESTLTNAY